MSSSSCLQVTNQKLRDAVGQEGVYAGQIHVDSGLPHGRGTLEYIVLDGGCAAPSNQMVASYEGEWQQGFWQGRGLCSLHNGDSYSGEFVQHERHGDGEYTWKMGANNHKQRLYQGTFHHNQRHGHGKYIWRTLAPTGNNEPNEPEELEVVSESTYVGMFDNGQRQGHGVYLSPSLKYTGDWKAGQYHGYGVLESSNIANSTRSKTYKGYFARGQKHGRGVETEHVKDVDGVVTDAVTHEGQWRNDQPSNDDEGEEDDPVLLLSPTNASQPKQSSVAPKKNNIVVLSLPEGCIDGQGCEGFYKGILQDNLPDGVGTMKYQQHPELMMEYEGFWVKGMKHGFGRVLYMNGDSYQGDFVQNKKQGQGEWKLSDGRQYKGYFHDDLPHTSPQKLEEKIRVVYPNNDMFHGQYFDGSRSGKGRFTWVDGGYYDGFWAEGTYEGNGELVTARTMYKGHFAKGKYHGRGKLTNILTDEIIYEGDWKEGVPAAAENDEDDTDNNGKVTTTIANHDDDGGGRFLRITQPPSDRDVAQSRQTKGRVAVEGDGSSSHHAKSNFVGDHNNNDDKKKKKEEEEKTPESDLLDKSACKAVVDLSVVDAQDNPGRYTGILHVTSRKPHGVGRMVYDDGNRVHEGFWEYGHRQGHGRCLFVQIGDFHEGNYHQNLRQGAGTYFWKDGRKFVGQYLQDERHGPGSFTYPNGDVYDGDFEHGQRSGKGTFTFHNKTCRYEGVWKAGMYDGEGQLTWQSVKETRKVTPTCEQITRETCKHRYEGGFASGVFEGEGKEFENEKLVRQGVWEQGKLVEESAIAIPPVAPHRPTTTTTTTTTTTATAAAAAAAATTTNVPPADPSEEPQNDDAPDNAIPSAGSSNSNSNEPSREPAEQQDEEETTNNPRAAAAAEAAAAEGATDEAGADATTTNNAAAQEAEDGNNSSDPAAAHPSSAVA